MKFGVRIVAAGLMVASMALVGASNAQASSPKWLQIAAGAFHTCGIRTDHSLWCWGYNVSGELGNPATTSSIINPVRVGTSTSWKSVTAGEYHTCALHASGSIYCWGLNDFGQLGYDTGADEDHFAPKKVGTSTSWKSVVAGKSHTCALHTSGSIYCWGDNSAGQLGDGTTTNHTTPKRVGTSTSWTSVTASGKGAYTCATHTGGSIYCWGNNGAGQLGVGDTNDRKSPTKVGSSTHWKAVSTGRDHTCALHSGGTVYCWGNNEDEQLGYSTGADILHDSPSKAGSSSSWTGVDAGGPYTCATHTGGSIYCWGGGPDGELGDGTTGHHMAAKKVSSSVTWSRLATGPFHACAINTSGYAYCWGYNGSGQLGVDSTDDYKTIPTKITRLGLLEE